MSKRRTRKGGWIKAKDIRRNAAGKPLCRFCKKEVSPPKRTFCSAECVHEHKIRTQPSYMRKCVFKRDRGVCIKCGCDTMKLQKVLAHAKEKCKTTPEFAAVLDMVGISLFRGFKIKLKSRKGYLWDADHIISVIEGGGECGLDNIQTLCIPCHKEKTAELRHRRRKKS